MSERQPGVASGTHRPPPRWLDYDLSVNRMHEQIVAVQSRDSLRADAIAVAAGLPIACVECVDTIGSTNLALMERGQPSDRSETAARSSPSCVSGPSDASDPLAPAVLVAARQQAGRGRRGRVWLSDAPDCLTMSISLHRPRAAGLKPLVGLPIALGVALAECLSRFSSGIGLKWPNDVQRDGSKIVGMLVETRSVGGFERIVIGIGVNWRLPQRVVRELKSVAGGLFDELPPVEVRERIAGELARALIDKSRDFIERGFADTAQRWSRFDVLAGRQVVVLGERDPDLVGVARGVDLDGSLRIDTPQGQRLVVAGEVSVRRADDTGLATMRENIR